MEKRNKSVQKKALPPIESFIVTIRGMRVILDSDLAHIYGVPTKRLNEQVKRNSARFPEDFMFQLTADEFQKIVQQAQPSDITMRSQNATASKRNIRYLPFVFTEHGAIMAANVLNSPRAVQMSVFVVRAFIKMRETLATNKVLTEKLNELEKKLTSRLDVHEKAIVHILDEIKKLMRPVIVPVPKKRTIGFGREDE